MNLMVISFLTLLPTVLVCWYVFVNDYKNMESAENLWLAFLLGGIGFLPIVYLQNLIEELIDLVFVKKMYVNEAGTKFFLTNETEILYHMLVSFLGIALIEILVLWMSALFVSNKKKNRKSLFEYILCFIFAFWGFAIVKNIIYVVNDGWQLLLGRLMIEFPVEFSLAVIMGCSYCLSKKSKKLRWFGLCLVLPFVFLGGYSLMQIYPLKILKYIFVMVYYLIYIVLFDFLRKIFAKEKTLREV